MRYCFIIIFTLFSFLSAVSGQEMMRCASQAPDSYFIDTPTESFAYNRNEIIIPVVFHVVWNTPEENISDELLLSQIQVLNDDYNQTNTDIINVPDRFQKNVTNVGIRFCLAQQDPDGNPNPGIIRTQTDIENIGGLRESESDQNLLKSANLGGSDAWDTERYLNVWISARDDGIAGIATFPTSPVIGTDQDGIELDYRTVGITDSDDQYGLGRTLTHEVGHYLNIEHLWGRTASCFNEGDMVDDTPEQGELYFGCITDERSSCGSVDMVNNFMNFVDDACLLFFTDGQRDRMIDALFRYRYGLISSGICNDSQPVPPRPLEVAVLRQTPFGYQINLSFLPQQDYRLDLFNTAGQHIWSESQNGLSIHLIETSSLSTGIYFLSYTADGNQQSTKIFITN